MPKQSPSRYTMVPLRRSSEPTATRRARMIIAILALVALTGPIAAVVSIMGMNKTVDFSEVDPQGRGIADAAAYQAMSDDTLKIPTSKTYDPANTEAPREYQTGDAVELPYKVDSVTWTGFDVNTFTGGDRESTFEVHRYLLVPDMDDYLAEYEKDLRPDSGGDEKDAEAEEPVESGNTSGTDTTDEPDASQSPAPSDGGTDTPTDSPTGDSTDPDATEEDPDLTEQEEIIEQGVTPYQLEVPVLITEDGARLAGAPSLAPWTESEAEPEGESDYSNFGNLRVDANNQTARQVGRWAVAYAENDEETLLDITGDSNSGNRYVGLGGWVVPDASSSVQILQAVTVNDGNQLLRVRVLLEDDRTKAGENKNRYRVYSDFDLLVTSPESATPQVVAWGAAGSGASLTPYKNAIPK